jgi:molybdenum cofactor biosynthesis enzyme MoaA
MELYVHIPFCVRKCRYCDFISFPAQEAFRERYVDHLLREAALRSAALPAPLRSVETVYIGGGTPSLLPPPLFSRLVQGLKTHFDFSAVSEFTVEANPGTVTAPWAEAILRLGVTRVSLGMQAAQPHILQILGRIHLFEDVSRSVSLLRSAGLKNLSLDLMFGIPGQTLGDWQDTLTTKMMVKLLELWLTEENCEQLQQLLQFYHPVDRAAMVYALLTYMMTGHEMTFKSALANHHYKLMQKAIRQDVSEVKKCCASCEHKGIGADGSRKCILTFLRVDSDFCCELWKISHNLKKVRVKI